MLRQGNPLSPSLAPIRMILLRMPRRHATTPISSDALVRWAQK